MTPSRSETVRLIRANAANLEYFFSRLEDASWLPFLLDEGFFQNPTPPEIGTTDEGQGWVRFPNWPESQYLARIASESPELVVEAIEQIPDTSNPRIHQDIVTAATALPGQLAAQVALREQRWLARYEGHLVSYPQPTSELLAHLAEEGEVKAALRFAGTLLAISAVSDAERLSSRRRAVSRISDWEYGKIIEKAWPPLMEAEPTTAFRFICHRLTDVIKAGFVDSPGFDTTYIWRSAVEDHGQNTGHSLLDTLVEAVRDIALTTAEKDAASRDLVMAEFARHDAPLFRRLTLFVLARFGSAEEVADALTDAASIDDVNVWHEYAELLRTRFGDLGATQRESILALIASGPDRELTKSQEERGITEQQIGTRRRHWRLQRYFLIAEDLDGDPRAEYESLLAEFGKPDHPTFHSVITHWTGPTSPYSTEELVSMGPEEVLKALRTWNPDGGSEDPSPEGLGRILEDAVEKDAPGYAKIAIGFADLDPHYVRGLLGGLEKAVKAKTRFPWKPVLDLCEQTLATGTRADDSEATSSWPRRDTVSLLSEGLNEGDAEFPPTERARVWRIIETLLDDPDPSPDRDEGHDPATVAINSVRGEAMHAAIRYGFWVERDLETNGKFKGIDSLPELATAIDRRLDPAIERSLAIRAVLGQWFVQFVRMDEQWAESLTPRIFPSDPTEAAFFSAAWNAYVVFNQAWISVFEILRATYEVAVDRFDEVDEERFMAGNPREHLGEHLFYLRFSGSIDLAADGTFDRFWRAAPVEIRKHVIRDSGWSLEHGNPQLSDDVRIRMVETWEWIFDQGHEERASLSAFGAWFGAQQLEDGWLLAQGQRVLEMSVPLEPEHVVHDALPRLATNHPREAVEILRLMIVTDPERWLVLGSVDEVRQTFATALGSDEETIRSDAVAVINLLGARGTTEFRDLIP